MPTTTLSNKQLANELTLFRVSIEAIINPRYKDLLVEVEKRLKGGEQGPPIKPTKNNVGHVKRKKDVYNKYFYK